MAGKDRQSPQGNQRWSGRGVGEDPTTTPGQYPNDIFGMPIPQGTGAAGSRGSREEPGAVNQPGQYPGTDPIAGEAYPQGTGAPGSQGRQVGDQLEFPPARVSPPGLFYAATEEDHAPESIPGRADGMYPPTTETHGVRPPTSTGAGSGSVRGPGHPNAGK